MSLRIWHYHQGLGSIDSSWVRLTIENDPVEIFSSKETEEGYESSACSYQRDGDTLFLYSQVSSRDCDGRTDWTYELECPILRGRIVEEEHPDPEYSPPGGMQPKWGHASHSQRDHSAEAMGY